MMSLKERLSEKLKLNKLKKESVQKAILHMMLEWEDMDQQLDSTEELLNEGFNEIESRQNELLSLQESVNESKTQLEVTQAHLDEKAAHLQMDQKQIEVIMESLEEKATQIKLDQKQIELNWESLDEKTMNIQMDQKQIELTRESLDEKATQIQLDQEQIELTWESLEEKTTQLQLDQQKIEVTRVSLEEKAVQIELDQQKNEVTRAALEARDIQLLLDQRKFEVTRASLEEKATKIEVTRASFEEKDTQVKLDQQHIEERSLQLDSREKQIDSAKEFRKEFFKDYLLKKKQLQSERNLVEQRSKELDSKEKHLNDVVAKLERDKRTVEQRFEELESKCQKLEACLRQSELDQNLYEEHFEELLSKEEKLQDLFERRSRELESKEKQLSEELLSKEKQLQYRLKQLEFDKNQFEQRSKELEIKVKQLKSRSNEYHNEHLCRVKTEPLEDMPDNNFINRSSADIQILVTMDGKALQIFLNGRANDHNLMSDEVCRALRLSSNPAKLVLDAMEGFYPPHLKNGDVEFDGSVVKSSCLLLLDQLMKLLPQIQPHVKDAALKLAGEWKQKMGEKNQMEVLGFTHLLASYGLGEDFDSDEILGLLEVVAEHRQTPELCRHLGLVDRVPDLIQNLSQKKEWLVAIRYTYAYDLVEKFPPALLLKAHLDHSETLAEKICEEGEYSTNSKQLAVTKQISALKDAMKCISDYEIESEYTLEKLERKIERLESKKRPAPLTHNSEPPPKIHCPSVVPINPPPLCPQPYSNLQGMAWRPYICMRERVNAPRANFIPYQQLVYPSHPTWQYGGRVVPPMLFGFGHPSMSTQPRRNL